jgi:hypothetical protein
VCSPRSPRLGRSSFARNHHVLDTEVGELPVDLDLGLAVAAVGGDGARRAPGAFLDQLRRVGRTALLHGVIQDDPPESVALSPA